MRIILVLLVIGLITLVIIAFWKLYIFTLYDTMFLVKPKQKMKIKKLQMHRRALVIISTTVLVVGFVVSPLVNADQFDDRIRQIQADNNQKQQSVGQLELQAESYQGEINRLQVQIDTVRAQIRDNEVKRDDLVAKIKAAEDELARQKLLLGESVKAVYVEGQISTLEMLASSKDLSEFLDNQQYRETIQQKIRDTLDKINSLKAQLKDQKLQVDKLLVEQQALNGQLTADQEKQNGLLAYTEDQKNQYVLAIQANKANIAELHRQQAAAIAALRGNNGTSAVGSPIVYKNLTGGSQCGGGYAYCNYGLDEWVNDPWGLHLARECVHYVAWALADRGVIGNIRYFSGNGNANQWEGVLSGISYTDNNPAGSPLVYLPIAPLGHVAIVEQDYGNGWVRVSQYNWQPGMYSTMDLKVTPNLRFFHF